MKTEKLMKVRDVVKILKALPQGTETSIIAIRVNKIRKSWETELSPVIVFTLDRTIQNMPCRTSIERAGL